MECELENIETLIKSAIESTTKTSGSLAVHLAKARQAIAEERWRIKKSFVFQALSFQNSEQTKLYVRFHQHYLIRLIDELFDFARSHDNSSKGKPTLAVETFFFYDQLEDILGFIRSEFPEHFDENSKVPKSQRVKFIDQVRKHNSKIKDKLKEDKVGQALRIVCTNLFENILTCPDTEITYLKTHFTERLIEELAGVYTTPESQNSIDDAIRSLLLGLNYNDEKYFLYYTEFIKDDLAQIECAVEQLEKLTLHHKLINQASSKNGFAFDPKLAPIAEKLSNWISEETQYLETKLRLSSASAVKENVFAKSDFKIEVDLSVSQFACLIKVFIEAGVIQNKNISELIRFLAKFVRTKRSESISNESFRIKYYNVESGTKRAVKNLFHTAISHINSN